VLAPAAVQGEGAPLQLVSALEALNRSIRPDVIIIARGGGSLEDLWAFNDERVVRAVAASVAPVASGVGHETDVTLVDFAADLRAPTPTGAAVLVAPHVDELVNSLNARKAQLRFLVSELIDERYGVMREMALQLEQHSPHWRLRQGMQRLDDLSIRLRAAMRSRMRAEEARLSAYHARLDGLDPHQVLRRGFALVQDPKGGLIRSAAQVKLGQNVRVSLQDGTFCAEVNEIENQTKGEA